MQEIRAITVKRKWAERMFLPITHIDHKWYEVRNFGTNFRGPVVVTISGEKIAYGILRLTSICPVTVATGLSAEELSFGHLAWFLTHARRCEPDMNGNVGKLGLWRWQGELPALLEAVKS